MAIPPELEVFQGALAKFRETPSQNQEVRLSQFIVPTAAEEVARAKKLITRVDSNPNLQRTLDDATNPLTISPKGQPSSRFSEEWLTQTEHLHPGPDGKPLPKLQVQKAASEGKE